MNICQALAYAKDDVKNGHLKSYYVDRRANGERYIIGRSPDGGDYIYWAPESDTERECYA